ncbi:NAD-dependent epimerase/dehydratase family protein [Neisseria dumasiana]|uniref:NAD(P)-dependent oxidoreductase n=1 Tax=Neisseria dumasiana TaxID=1931275 RepID=A0ABX3WQ59_9NEIS|nr:NAD-dependent epimerase/dehydratase family protein [Neisseria dumasiana]OSI36196.1 NAD(P)-dependent oxidoreductase [Neisseria dumasiana]UOO83487.1 NAD-dependent epimerase/dehydratase family protein [Neisseria dumasiana]
MNTPDCAILGMGYLGKALAEKLFEQGSRVAAVKKTLTSDDINLPVELNIADLNDPNIFQTAFWQKWADKLVWICLLPPSSAEHYAPMLRQWLALAVQYGVRHVIYSSSTGVYGDKARACNEQSMPDPQTGSARKVLEAEQVFLNSGIPNIDILRFGGLYSADRHPLNSLLKRSGITGAEQPVNMVHKDFAVAALHHAVCTPGGVRIRNIIEPRHPSKREFYHAEALKLGLPEPDYDPTDTNGGKTVDTIYDDFAHIFV